MGGWAESFSEGAGTTTGSTLDRDVPTDQMLISKAPVEENADAFTAVASSPAVNSLRISRSRSTQGGRSN